MLKAYKYRIYPTNFQKEQLNIYFGCCRFVYNLALETKIAIYDQTKKSISSFDLMKQMKELKDTDAPWLKECPAQSLQASIVNLEKSYSNFFKGSGFPKFKSKKNKQSIHFPQGVKINFKNNKISLPKLKKVNINLSREFKGKIKTVTVSKTNTDKYFVSILIDTENRIPEKVKINEKNTVGVDFGIKKFITLSDGTFFENIKLLRNNLSKLRIEQRKLQRKYIKHSTFQSKNFYKQKLIVSKIHEKIKDQREDYLHKISTLIIKKYDTICLEDLDILAMMKNKLFSSYVGEIGWNIFEKMLIYKANWYGKNIIYIDRFEPSSKTCSNCGHIKEQLSLKERTYSCDNCGFEIDRDLNAAINIKNSGLGYNHLTLT